MTNEELVEKIHAGENVEENIERLYFQNEGLIAKIASRYIGEEDFEDLKQEGFFGLMTALELWSPDGGASFSTYAFYWIRQTLRRYIDDKGALVRLPGYQKDRIHKYEKEIEKFRQHFGKTPTAKELSLSLNISPDEVDKIKDDAQFLHLKSINEAIGDDTSLTFGDMIADEKNGIDDALERIQDQELSLLLWSLVDDLEKEESQVLRMRFKDGLTFNDCGENLNISKERVRNIEIKALKKMRDPAIRAKLTPYIEDRALVIASHSAGLKSFMTNWTSAPERAVIFIENYRDTLQERREEAFPI